MLLVVPPAHAIRPSLLWQQVGIILAPPSGTPLESLTSDSALELAALVPAQADAGEVTVAKQTVLQYATQLQARHAMLPGSCMYDITLHVTWPMH
jgi:hypothetical protein